jgi:ABC-type thiamine transport system substrate-binding protein
MSSYISIGYDNQKVKQKNNILCQLIKKQKAICNISVFAGKNIANNVIF